MNLAWIPNSLTLGNLLFGFLSIVFASQGKLAMGGICILLAALLDGFDGQTARLLKVVSKLGAELDSLADCVAFGVAPGYLVWKSYLFDLMLTPGDKVLPVGIFIAAIFPMCAAYRLARFNVAHENDSFRGLPSPIAGIVIALFPIAFEDPQVIIQKQWIFIPFFIVVALLMVSTVQFPKPQMYIFQKIHGIKLVIFIATLVVLFIAVSQWIIFIIIALLALYIISGVISFIIQFIQEYKY